MRTAHALRAADAGAARRREPELGPRFQLRLPLGYYAGATGIWGTGETCSIARATVEFVPAERSLRVGDTLHYVLVFPGSAGRTGAVASCRGQVIQAGASVVVTLDHYRMQTTSAARASRRDPWTHWLLELCEAARSSSRITAMRRATSLPT